MPIPTTPLPILTPPQYRKLMDQIYTKGPDDCWMWLGKLVAHQTTHPYGVFHFGRKSLRVHRYIFSQKLGRDIRPGMLARHLCHHSTCCNPAHLEEGTQKENINGAVKADRMQHGRNHYDVSLTEDQVREIRRLYIPGIYGMHRLGRRFGVSPGTIGPIIRRKTWKHVK